ncbi:Hsp20 family protein [Sinorhizobium meliloti]|nr:Hsp20 family protein [Sinorhizobium meliloti]
MGTKTEYDMSSRHIHINPLLSRVVGIDRFIGLAEAAINQASESAFPPYNIIKIADDAYRIELAVAGFSLEELSIETKEKVVVVSGERKQAAADPSSFLYRGIANRGFKREFQLADYVEVKGASLLNGILSVDLVREVPESQKYRKIDIGTITPQTAPGNVEEPA